MKPTNGCAIYNGDVARWAREYSGPKFHAVLCDAPYEINFMNKGWDNSGVAFDVATWQAIYEVLHPGAFMLVFGGSRTFHRMAVAIEDAGFRMHPTICYIFGSGFPKATRIDTQIDNHGGSSIGWFGPWLRQWRIQQGITQKELAGHFPSKTGNLTGCVANWELGYNMPTAEQFNTLCQAFDLPFGSIEEAKREILATRHDGGNRQVTILGKDAKDYDITAPATPLAKVWDGHRYGGQALKPAAEFILCAQRPYEGRPVDNIVATGAGSLNIDAGRVGTEDNLDGGTYGGIFGNGQPAIGSGDKGRWPANVALSHSPDCTPSHCSAGCAVRAVGEQSGELTSGTISTDHKQNFEPGSNGSTMGGSWHSEFKTSNRGGDSGTAARYFFNADYYLEVAEQIESAAPMMYTPKADRWQREAGLFGEVAQSKNGHDRTMTGGPDTRVRPDTPRRNTHSTVKPLALTHWLASLLLPPDEYAPRRLLVPFSGVASECIGAMLAGWDFVQGVEIEAEYIDIAKQRVEFWQQYAGMDYETARRYAEVKQAELERAARMNAPVDDLPLFRGDHD